MFSFEFIKIIRGADEDRSRIFEIKPWFTQKKSYIQIYKPINLNSFQCGDQINAKIVIKSSEPFLSKFHFQMQSRSNVLITGYFDSKLNKLFIDNGKDLQTDLEILMVKTLKLDQPISENKINKSK